MLLFYVIFFLIASTDAKLVFVNVVHRHGNRTPEWVYPTDPYREEYLKIGLGILNDEGKRETYDLGRFIRERYSDFLPSEYNEADIHVEASSKSRTMASAYCCLAGLYTPQGKHDSKYEIFNLYEPIPVYSIPRSMDKTIRNKRSCPRYDALLEKAFQSEFGEERKKKYKPILAELTKYSGLNLTLSLDGLQSAAHVFDTLFIEKSFGRILPNWTTHIYEPLQEPSHFRYFVFPYYNVGLRRLYCGQLLKEMTRNFDQKIKGQITEKWWHYSGHDTTIAGLLHCLQLYDNKRPVYASAVFVELHQNSKNDYEVAVVYKRNQSNKVENLKLENCDVHCPLDTFKGLVKDVIPDDWDKECKLDYVMPGKKTNGGEEKQISAFFVILVSIFSLCTHVTAFKM